MKPSRGRKLSKPSKSSKAVKSVKPAKLEKAVTAAPAPPRRLVPPAPIAHAEGERQHALRHHTLVSLLELSRQLSLELEPPVLADFVLLNLMGYLGTQCAGMWMSDPDLPDGVMPLATYGVPESSLPVVVRALNATQTSGMVVGDGGLIFGARQETMAPPSLLPVFEARIEIVVPLVRGPRVLGWITLGGRASGEALSSLDLEVLRTYGAMVGVALESHLLFRKVQQQNEVLNRANEELRELDRLKSEFLRNVNHELRTPLSVIIGTAECLALDRGEAESQQRLVGNLLYQGRVLEEIVEKILDFSRSSGATESPDREIVSLEQVVADFVRPRVEGARERGHELTAEITVSRHRVVAVREWLMRILEQLVDNAVKFTPPGTPIRVRTREVGHSEGTWCLIEVEDDGPGIPADEVAGLFTAFHQLDSSMTRTVGGLGLGLATARHLAERMNGRLTAESTVGHGTTVRLSFPSIGSSEREQDRAA